MCYRENIWKLHLYCTGWLLALTGALYVVMCYWIPSNSGKPIFYDVSKNIAIIVKISKSMVKTTFKISFKSMKKCHKVSGWLEGAGGLKSTLGNAQIDGVFSSVGPPLTCLTIQSRFTVDEPACLWDPFPEVGNRKGTESGLVCLPLSSFSQN